jgi:hypothetical protein
VPHILLNVAASWNSALMQTTPILINFLNATIRVRTSHVQYVTTDQRMPIRPAGEDDGSLKTADERRYPRLLCCEIV